MADVLDAIDQTTDTDLDLGTQDDQQAVDTTQDDQQQTTTETEKVDGRKFPTEWSRQMKELRETRPELADMLTKLRDTYGRYSAVSELAPKGVEDIRGWKTTIDAIGGSEAAADMMQRTAAMEAVDARIESGDFGVIGELSPEWQKGFYQMLPDALADLSEKDPTAFSAAVMPHFAAALAGTGMGDHLKAMHAKADGNPELQALIKQQYDWFQQQTSGAGKMQPGAKSADPQVARLQAELDSRRQADDSAFEQGAIQYTNNHVKAAFTRDAAVYLKQLSLTEAQQSDLSDSFNAKLVDKLAGDKAFQAQLKAYKSLKNRNPETVNTYIQGKIDESAKSIIDGLVTARYGGMKRKVAPITTGTTTTDNGVTRVAQAPGQDQWDMTKMEAMGYDATVKKGLFYLQGGRSVQVVRQ